MCGVLSLLDIYWSDDPKMSISPKTPKISPKSRLLMKALKQIAHLRDEIQRLDAELQKKESILSGFISEATEQSW